MFNRKTLRYLFTGSFQSAPYLLLVTMVSIFIAEGIIMNFLSCLPPMDEISGAVIDSLLLVMLVSPVLYYFLFRPLVQHIERHNKISEELKSTHLDLAESNRHLQQEIAERNKAEELFVQLSQDWEDTFNITTDMITIHDKDFNIIRANSAAEKILGLPFLDNAKAKCYRVYHGAGHPPEGCPSCDCLRTGKPAKFELFEPHLNRYLEIRSLPRVDSDNQITGLVHVVRDITEHKKIEERLKTMSLTDDLTGLYNRRGFFTMLDQQLKIIKREGKKAILLFADIDDFKQINDSFGHNRGDAVLVDVADLLKSTYRESDIIARLGGDEFVVFHVGEAEANADQIAARLHKKIIEYNTHKDPGFRLSISIGVAPYDPERVNSIDEVLAEADKLMYEQKSCRNIN